MRPLLPDHTILGLIAAQPKHGYDLLALFQAQEELGRVWTLSQSQLYNVLKRLERKGFIHGEKRQSSMAPTRTEYRITPTGYKKLEEWLFDRQPPASIRGIRVEFLSKLHICSLLGLDPRTIIEKQRATCVCQRDRILTQRHNTESVTESLTLEFVISQLNAAIDWLDNIYATYAVHSE
jgi:DNA-binding PadR family transcriptional regulator